MGLLEKWKGLLHQRKLKKLGITGELYEKLNDPAVLYRAATIDGFYHGYAAVVCLTSPQCYSDQYRNEVHHWCKDTLRSKYRSDGHRVSYGWNSYSSAPCWYFDELGGGDHWFFAFEAEQDATLFSMRWQ
jgi:hypothetical protein